MIPKLLLAAVSAYLALEGFSVLTAPKSLIKEALQRIPVDPEQGRDRERR